MSILNVKLFHTPNKHESSKLNFLDNDEPIYLNENDFIHFQICSSETREMALWLSDFRFPLIISEIRKDETLYIINVNGFFDYSELSKFTVSLLAEEKVQIFYKIFLNNYGKCNVQIEYDGNYLDVGVIEVTSEKIKELDDLLDYLYIKNVFYWESISLTKNKARTEDEYKNNILWTLNFVDETLGKLEQNFLPNAHNDKFSKLDHHHEIVDWKEANIDDQSLIWLVQNLDALESCRSSDYNRFLVSNRSFKTDYILSDSIIETTNVYENQCIHQFVDELYSFLLEAKAVIKNKIYNVKPDSFKAQLISCFLKRIEGKIDSCVLKTVFIKNELDFIIPTKIIESEIGNPYRMMSKDHYWDIYGLIIIWLQKGIVLYNPEAIFTGTKDIAKLYEIFCLYKLMDVLDKECNFIPQFSPTLINQLKISEDILFEETLEINSRYKFIHKTKDITVNIYYELLPPNLDTISKAGGKGLRPDFFITIEYEGKESYLILDAKYKKTGTIEMFDYQDLCLKYLHGIGLKYGGTMDIIGLIILNPIENSGVEYYHKSEYDIEHDKVSLPIIGRLEMRPSLEYECKMSNLFQSIFSKIISVEI